jgi:hypothetical protein
MPRDRFKLLLKFLHFSDSEAPNGPSNRLWKIQPLVDLLNERNRSVLRPGRDVVIDETMVPWRGRLIFRQYIPGKSHKYGVKLFKLCTPNAYTLNLSIYAGRQDKNAGLGLADGVVRDLMHGLTNEGRVLFVDNFYTSVPLANYLLSKETHICGTLRVNRRLIPQEVVRGKMVKGTVRGLQNDDGIKVIRWESKRAVCMLTTVPGHDATLSSTGKKDRTGAEVKKPDCVIQYNVAKKGVDLSDQLGSYYTSLRKGLKWYRKVAFELLTSTSLVNAWVVFNSTQTSPVTLLTFRERVARGLIGVGLPQTPPVSPAPSATRGHELRKKDRPSRMSRRRCVSCYASLRKTMSADQARKKAPKVNTYCATCPNEPIICVPCFANKHRRVVV